MVVIAIYNYRQLNTNTLLLSQGKKRKKSDRLFFKYYLPSIIEANKGKLHLAWSISGFEIPVTRQMHPETTSVETILLSINLFFILVLFISLISHQRTVRDGYCVASQYPFRVGHHLMTGYM